ncbi:MAG: DsbC family protein [Pseudomonadota bacterium]
MAVSLTIFLSAASMAQAETAAEKAVRDRIAPNLGDDAKITSVVQTPYGGLFEVRIGNQIVYTDQKAQYLFVGRILDSTTMLDYTKQRLESINTVKFSDLPLDLALKTVKGNGKRVIAVFEDPNCSYCKKFRQTLQEIDNVTVYTFMYNILSPDSVTKSRDIWCSADRNKAWDDWMLNDKVAPTAPANCTTPHEKVFQAGQKLGVTGTPTIFFTNGTRVPGAMDARALEARLASIK